MIYSYKAKVRHLSDAEKECLEKIGEVITNLSPRELKQYHCADFQFSNGDTFVLRPKDVDLTSAIVIR